MRTNMLFKMVMASCVILVLIGGLGYFSVSKLKQNARLIVEDSLPGLTYAGAANATLAAAYNNLLLFLTSEDAKERARFRRAVDEISKETTDNLDHYSKTIFSCKEDQNAFSNLVKRREKYLQIRSEVMALADGGRQGEALKLFKEDLKPAYEEYRAAGEMLLEYNIQLGEMRGREITTICNLTQVFVAVIGVFLFMVGFLFGFSR